MSISTDPEAFPTSDRLVARAGDFTLMSSIETLGHHVVASMNWHAQLTLDVTAESLRKDPHYGVQDFIATAEAKLPEELGEVRDRLRGLDDDAAGKFGYYLDEAIPLFFMRRAPGAELVVPPPSWRNWLANDADDGELLNFLQWHNHVNEELIHNEGVNAAIARHREQGVEASRLLIEEGYFSPSTNLEDSARLEFGDIFDTYFQERAAYYSRSHHSMTLGHSLKGTETSRALDFISGLMSTLTHEQVHAMLCRSAESHTSPLVERWINEALTEEASRLIRAKLGDETLEDDRIYEDERELLGLLLSSGNKDEGLKYALRAYTGGESDREAFTQYLDKMWGATDVLHRINSAVIKSQEIWTNHGKKGRKAETKAIKQVIMFFRNDPQAMLHREPNAPTQVYPDAAIE